MKKFLLTLFAAIVCAATMWATTAYVSNYSQLSSAISDASVDNIIVTANIDVPCANSGNAGANDLTGASTAQFVISRSLTLQSQAGFKYIIKRTSASGSTSTTLKSLFAIRGNGNGTSGTDNLTQNTREVSFTNIIIDGGANWGSSYVCDRYNGEVNSYGNSGRAMIDVYYGGTLNLEDGTEIRNGFTTKSDNSLLNDAGNSACFGGAVRVDYHNNTGGGTVNIKAGAYIHDCATYRGYGGALGAYNYARLNLYGGTISNCSSSNGGAIACTYRSAEGYGDTSAGTIRMYGGTISNCCAVNGGALCTHGPVHDYVLGGTITGCSATSGGAIYQDFSTTEVHIVDHSSGKLTISNCSNTNATSTSSTGGYSYVYLKTGSTSVTPVYQVTFQNDNSNFAVLSVVQGTSLGEAFPAAPAVGDRRFVGWYNGNTEVTKNTPINANTTVTAKWDFLGNGTSSDPYLIPSTAAWDTLAHRVTRGITFNDKFFSQTANISITTMAGWPYNTESNYKPFSGTYDGDEHTLNVTLNGSGESSAPFIYLNNATIKNLHITGSLNTTGVRPASIASFVGGNTTISNCWSAASISSSKYFSDNHKWVDAGALVARVNGSATLTMSGCLFTGSITYSEPDAYEGGGMVGWTQSGAHVTLDDCVFAPSEINISDYDACYMFVAGNAKGTHNNCYYNDVANASSLKKQGKHLCTITAATGVTVANAGSATTYSVSGITGYGTGIKYNDVLYAGEGETISLNLSGSTNGFYAASTGTLSTNAPYSLTMTEANSVISTAVASVTTSANVTTNYSTFAAAVSAWENTSKLTLLANVETSSTITVNNIRTLDLNGYGIKSTGARVIAVEAGGNLTIMDSNTENLTHRFSISYPYSSNIVNAGLATLDEANGTIVIEGGYITGGNTPSYNDAYTKGGAGIRVCEGSFTLQGGTIIGNHSQSGWGGGVMVTKGGTFNMSGGAICYNRADWGSGLSMYGNNDLGATNKDGITCTVTGGSIHHNYANGGDAVHNVSRDYTVTYTMTGGSIRDNYANNSSFNRAGLHVDGEQFSCNISGDPVVINNYCSSKLRNATIENGLITITGPLSGANIGVWKAQTGIFATNMEGNGDISQFVSDRSDYNVALHYTGDAKLAIASSFSATPTAKSLTYNGSAQELVNAGSSSHGTIEYKLGEGEWSTAIPAQTNADTYTVYYHIIGDANHTDHSGSSVSVTINQAPLSCTADNKSVTYGDAAPTYTASYSGWVNSETQTVLSGSLAFACDYSAGSNVGDYTITPSGVTATNYDITFNTGTLTVNKAASSITAVPTPLSLNYTGSAQTLINAGSVEGGEMQYKLNDGEWVSELPQATDVGNYTVYYKVIGDANHNNVAEASFAAAIAAVSVLYDNASPTAVLTGMASAQETFDITMNRTIYADGDYNTICLPFDVTESDFANPTHPLYGYERLKSFRSAQVTGSGQNLSIDIFVQDATEIIAGVPYLITYPSSHGDIVDAVFSNVLITATEPGNVSANGVTFQGMFAPVHITTYEQNTTQDFLFLGANNELYWPSNDGSSMRGFRAYFIIDRNTITPAQAPKGSHARIVEREDNTTEIESIMQSATSIQKVLRNGQLIIIRNGVEYNANGQMIK